MVNYMEKRGPKPKRKEVFWSSEMAYAVGLLVTDGSLSVDGRHIDFTSKDVEQLENFMACIGRKVTIGTKVPTFGTAPVPRIQFSDVTLYTFLISIGLIPNKSKILGEILVPEEYFSDFLRGHHDGDGAFTSYYDPRWKNSFMFYTTFLSASEAHITWLRERIRILLGIAGHISTTKKSCVLQLRYAKKESLVLLAYMYPSTRVIALSRKRLKIEKALGIVGLTLPSRE